MKRPFILNERDRWIYIAAVAASFLLSFWMAFRESMINPDAVCYLLTAEEIGRAGFASALHVCGQALAWPFYSTSIYVVASVTHLSYLQAAYLLDGLFSAMSVVTFVAIVRRLGGKGLVLILAALVILLSHQFNSVRQYIVRDHGFWAFYLVSLLCGLCYFERPRLSYALMWSISLLVAALFRIEAAVFLFLTPLFVLLRSGDGAARRILHYLQLNVLTILLAALIAGWLWMHPQETLLSLGRVHTLYDEWLHWFVRVVTRFQSAREALAASVLPPESAHDAGVVLSVTLVVWYLLSILNNVSWVYAALIGYALYVRAAIWRRPALLLLCAYLAANFVITFGFFAENFFLSNRYLLAFSLVFMLWVPFGLASLCRRFTADGRRYALAMVMLAVTVSALGGIFDFGYSKAYMREAAVWLASNVPEEADLYVNNRQILYFSGHHRQDFFKTLKQQAKQNQIAAAWWKQYDYVALRLAKDEGDPVAAAEMGRISPVEMFKNKRGDRVVIYHIKDH